jgi:hypothetical protein
MSSPEFYTKFATEHIGLTRGLGILHFAGCGDSEAHNLVQDGDLRLLQVKPPADDIPSWVPDWRVQSRPLTLLPDVEKESSGFSATESDPEFKIDHNILHVRAREKDKIKVCGWPYYESHGRSLDMTEHEIFNCWFNLAKMVLKDSDVEPTFASTLVMDGKVAVAEHQDKSVSSADIPNLFGRWASRNLDEFKGPCKERLNDGVEDSNRYGYNAEEICRNRTFFITEAGRLGLGSVHVSPGASIYLIHGLKAPFVIHHQLGMHVLRGECYVHGLMNGRIQTSDQDSFLYLE